MICLGIQTAVQPYSVALVSEKGLLAEHTLQRNYDASEDLMYWIDELCKSIDITTQDIAAIGIVNGPGSYTGLRIGVTTAKTIAMVYKIPVYGISSLESLATSGVVSGSVIVSVMPARKNEFNFQVFSSTEGDCVERSEQLAMMTEEFAEFLNRFEEPIVVSGYITDNLLELLSVSHSVISEPLTAHVVATKAYGLLGAGNKGVLRDVMPRYSHQPLLGGPAGKVTA